MIQVTSTDLQNGVVTGTKFEDINDNGQRDGGEPGLAGVTIYVDLNGNLNFDAGEPFAVSSSDGSYSISDVPPGTHALREVVPIGYRQSYPISSPARLFAIDFNETYSSRIVEVHPVSGATVAILTVPAGVSGATAGLAFDGTALFLVDSNTDTLYKLDPDTGATIASRALDIAGRWDGVAVLGGSVFVSGPFLRVIEIVDPVTMATTGTI